jgi:CRP-like cAMP-binding protein
MKHFTHTNCSEGCLAKNYNLFRHLTPEELAKIDQVRNSEIHKRGTVLYHEGNRINGFYCIQSGILKIYKTGIDGKEQIIRFAKPGDLIGFRSVMSNETACTSAEVIEDTICCYIPGDTLIELVKSNGSFSLELLQITCKELGEANSYITDIAQKTVRERLAEVLIHLKDEFGMDENSVLKINLTREELANIVGTATESVIRLLSEFKNDRLIELNGRKIKLLDSRKIQKIANLF